MGADCTYLTMTTRLSEHLLCTISNVWITYEMNKAAPFSILLLEMLLCHIHTSPPSVGEEDSLPSVIRLSPLLVNWDEEPVHTVDDRVECQRGHTDSHVWFSCPSV